MKIYAESFEILNEIKTGEGGLEGRVADGGISLMFLLSMVANAGDGDHIEIGALFGASAIAVGMMKERLGLEGEIYVIDPYDKEERASNIRPLKDTGKDDMSADPNVLMRNAETFGVKINLVQEYSNPWPEQLVDNTFATGYIDGDHQHNMPYLDFQNLRERVSGYIGLDNVEEGYMDVMGALGKIMTEDEDWTLFYKNGTFAALRRRLPPRGGDNAPITAA